MNTPENSGYVKRILKDFSLSIKLQVVVEIETGKIGRLEAHLKYGIHSISTIIQFSI